MKIPQMRAGTERWVAFDSFIFTIDLVKGKWEAKKKKALVLEGDTLHVYLDLQTSNPDTACDTVWISAEAFKDDTTYLGLLYDTTLLVIPPGDTTIVDSLSLYVPGGLEFGDTVCVIATLNQQSGVYVSRATYYETPFIYGDANGDGVVDLADVVFLITYLFRGGTAPDPEEAGDANCDAIVNVGDVVYLIAYLYRGGDPPGC
jgi:hypothetical protein